MIKKAVAALALAAAIGSVGASPAQASTTREHGRLYCWVLSVQRTGPNTVILHRSCHYSWQPPLYWFRNKIGVIG